MRYLGSTMQVLSPVYGWVHFTGYGHCPHNKTEIKLKFVQHL